MTAGGGSQTRPPTPPTKKVRFPPPPQYPMFLQESTRRAQPHRPALTQKSKPPVARVQCVVPTFERQRLQSQVLQSPQGRQATPSSAQMPVPVPLQKEGREATGQPSPSFARQTKTVHRPRG